MTYFHVYTKGIEDSLIFWDEEDYIAGMNFVAIASYRLNIKILAFVLMSNHFHFVISGDKASILKFINQFKSLMSRYIHAKYGLNKYLKHLDTSLSYIETDNEGLKKTIAYVLSNPVKAGVNTIVSGYSWGSASCYFNDLTDSGALPLAQFAVRYQRSILHTAKRLPDSWLLAKKGYILPISYVDYKHVEALFGRSTSYEYFISRSRSYKKSTQDNMIFSDSTLNAALKEVLDKKYSVNSIHDMDSSLKRMLLRDLKTRFTCPVSQLARVTCMELKEVLLLLEN